MSLEEDLYDQRIRRIGEIEALGFRAYGQRFDFSHTIPQILAEYGDKAAEQLEPRVQVRIAGRVATKRLMGKAGFAHLQQDGEKLQIYVRKDAVPANDFALYQLLEAGDIIGVEGYLFRTKTGELSVHAERLQFLSKTLYSMPEKWHGLEDIETRYRQRYLDLIANPEARKVFVTRSKIVSSLRRQLESRGYLEVETPMLQPIYGGAAARPFKTHHNTLDIDLFLRIAPELYLKRLVVGGLERVYEINRNFRNEGISTQHNPEFTMLEFYQAYTDFHGMMDLSEDLLRQAAIDVTGSAIVEYQGEKIDFGNFRRVTMRDAVGNSSLKGHELMEEFERSVESTLIQPTIVYDYPVEVSPLSKNKPDDPDFVERFEIYVAGMEIGNAFTELNDPREQRHRFEMQLAMREKGDEEAHQMDEDYVRALAYGMPPAGGEGIGIDRVTMILTNSRSIRDVILFPLLRPVMSAQTFELFVAARYLRAKRKQAVISVITVISIVGVAAGVMALVIGLAINNGFRSTLQQSLLGTTAHVMLLNQQASQGIANWRDIEPALRKLPHVTSVSPGLYGKVLLTGPLGGAQADGAILKGVPLDTPPDMLRHLKQGSFDELKNNTGLPGIILGARLAQNTGMLLHSVVSVLSPQGPLTPFGIKPERYQFRVVGIIESGFYDVDSTMAFTSLQEAQIVFDTGNVVSDIELQLDDIYKASEVAQAAEKVAGPHLVANTWMEQYRQILSALNMEKVVTAITIGLIQLVGALNILITLIMMVMEKNRDIAVLMSMGAKRQQIRKIFVLQGMLIGVVGTSIGLALGYTLSYFADRYHWLTLNQEVYSLSYVPFNPRWQDGIWIAGAAIFVSFIATLYPARSATRIAPVEALRYE